MQPVSILAWPQQGWDDVAVLHVGLLTLFRFALHEVVLKDDILQQFSQISWGWPAVIRGRLFESEHVEAFIKKVHPTIVILS